MIKSCQRDALKSCHGGNGMRVINPPADHAGILIQKKSCKLYQNLAQLGRTFPDTPHNYAASIQLQLTAPAKDTATGDHLTFGRRWGW
jgi:hypothetical protein